MALSVSMASVGGVIANASEAFTITVTNTNAAAVTLQQLQVTEQSDSNATVGQPNFLAANMPVGLGNPVIAAGASVTYGFSVVCNNLVLPGASPQNQPGGSAPINRAWPAQANFTLMATGQTSDGSVFSSTLQVPVLSIGNAVAIAQGGAYQYAAGANLINGLTTGAV